jgi:hypothetical protein
VIATSSAISNASPKMVKLSSVIINRQNVTSNSSLIELP